MKNLNMRHSQGLTFTELMLTVVISSAVILFSYKAMREISRSSTSSQYIGQIDMATTSIKSALFTEASTNFDHMTADDRPLDTTFPNLTCTADIDIPDSNRARKVVLTFSYKEGSEYQTEKREFAIVQTRAKSYGAVVTVCARTFLNLGSDSPVSNVKFVADAQDLPLTDVYATDASGCTTMKGVRLGSSVYVKVNAKSSGHFFDIDTANGFPTLSFTRRFLLPDTSNGRLDLSSTPYRLRPPGAVKGIVKDPLNGNAPVANGRLWLRGNSNFISGNDYSNQEKTTNSNGEFFFDNVLPGNTYHLYFVGSQPTTTWPYKLGTYLATATPGDRWDQTTPPHRFTVNSGSTYTVPSDILTTKRGTLSGSFQMVTASGGQFQSPTAGSITGSIRKYMDPNAKPLNRTITYHGASSRNLGTTGSQYYVMDHQPNAPSTFFIENTNLNYTFTEYNPYIIDRDHGTYRFDEQYSKVLVRPGNWAPGPLVPVLFYHSGSGPYPPATSKLVLVTHDNNPEGFIMRPDSNGGSVPEEFFARVYPNQPNSKNVPMLHRSALANVTGTITNASGGQFDPAALGITTMFVRIDKYSQTMGVQFSNSSTNSSASIQSRLGGSIINGSPYTFTMSQFGTGSPWPNNILPIVGNNTLKLEFIADVGTTLVSKNFKSHVIGITKRLVGNSIVYDDTVVLSGIRFNLSAVAIEGPSTGNWAATNVTVGSGNMLNISRNANQINSRIRVPAEITALAPGGLGTATFAVGPSPDSHLSDYYLKIDNSPTYPEWRFNNTNPGTHGPQFTFNGTEYVERSPTVKLSVVKVGFGRLYGTVKDVEGNPINTGNVRLEIPGGIPPGQPGSITFPLNNNACTTCGANVNYAFGHPTQFQFLLTAGNNFRLVFEVPGHNTQATTLAGYEGFDVRFPDVTMIETPTTGGGGSVNEGDF